jgi:hypothetical protein
MRLFVFGFRAAVVLLSIFILGSLLASTLLYFQEKRANDNATIVHQQARALADSEEAIVVSLSVEGVNAKLSDLRTLFEFGGALVKVSKPRLLVTDPIVKVTSEVDVSMKSISSLRLVVDPVLYPRVTINDGRIALFLDYIRIGDAVVKYDDRHLFTLPAAITNIGSYLCGIVYASRELVSLPSQFAVGLQAEATIPNVSAKIGGSAVTFQFASQPLKIHFGPTNFIMAPSGGNIMFLSSTMS